MLFSIFLTSNSFCKPKIEHQTVRGTLKEIVERVSNITKVKYIYKIDLKGNAQFSKNFKITKINADSTLSHLLNLNGFTRVEVEPGIKKIIEAKDVRYSAVPSIETSKKITPNIPANSDYFMLKYRFESEVSTKDIQRSLKPFLSRFGRIVDVGQTREVILQDTGLNLKRLYRLLISMDKNISNEYKKEIAEKKEFEKKLLLEKAKNCSNK
tara:strand:- start:3554 stop:4186 length:633 start_codon:yes stop_codon:yes gene_type:complete